MEIIDSRIDFIPISQFKMHSLKSENKNETELKEVCQQFESIFLNYMLKSMRDTIPDGGMFEKGVTFDIIQSMHDEALAEEISQNGGIGLAQQLYEQLSKYI
ncbi:rod-binding protein [Tepidanaerobacter acetatoxydans]|uniref:rod-binding protein n=1 Tax=Tepidanaerobacter acetatoxydans TaxID=499229 RepID=UPI001BD1DDFD|nr:rod-binding protein [Tepidanaerobacter acetatoxydans]